MVVSYASHVAASKKEMKHTWVGRQSVQVRLDVPNVTKQLSRTNAPNVTFFTEYTTRGNEGRKNIFRNIAVN